MAEPLTHVQVLGLSQTTLLTGESDTEVLLGNVITGEVFRMPVSWSEEEMTAFFDFALRGVEMSGEDYAPPQEEEEMRVRVELGGVMTEALRAGVEKMIELEEQMNSVPPPPPPPRKLPPRGQDKRASAAPPSTSLVERAPREERGYVQQEPQLQFVEEQEDEDGETVFVVRQV